MFFKDLGIHNIWCEYVIYGKLAINCDHRTGDEGEVGNENLFLPGLLPKVPGRFYYLFGKPIETKGKEELLRDRKSAEEFYMQIKSEVASNIDILLKKREEDPYRSIIDRTIYRLLNTPAQDVPSFTPWTKRGL